jgi:chemotaxis protein histidine kinase CheA
VLAPTFTVYNHLGKQEKNLKDLQMEFHKLKGTGKTHGFGEVTDISAFVEALLKKQELVTVEIQKLLLKALNLLKMIYQCSLNHQTIDIRDNSDFLALKAAHQQMISSEAP